MSKPQFAVGDHVRKRSGRRVLEVTDVHADGKGGFKCVCKAVGPRPELSKPDEPADESDGPGIYNESYLSLVQKASPVSAAVDADDQHSH